jgi:flagellar protein FliO/FliZ
METIDYIKFVASLALVLGLMGGLALILKKIGLGNIGIVPADKRRLKIVEILPLDARRKALILRRDDKEHLVILGVNGETVIETDIERKDV